MASTIFQALTEGRTERGIGKAIENLEYTCGSTFADIECDDHSVLRSVFVKANLTCNTPTEIPYYTAGIPQYVITVEVRMNYSKSS